jgi:tRNA-2-methylthio-N6-dimethylallyladenosine synthase
MYFYSERPGTLAARRYEDDIDLVTKKRRLQEIVDVQWTLSNESNKRDVGSIFEVLIEGNSKRNEAEWMGRTSQNKVVVFPKGNFNYQKGDYAQVKIQDFTKGTLLGSII